MNPPEKTIISPELKELVVQLQAVHREAEALGLFLGDRPLLRCPECGLMEDAAFDGRLITYTSGDAEMLDTGLRFTLSETKCACPMCHALFPCPVEEEAK